MATRPALQASTSLGSAPHFLQLAQKHLQGWANPQVPTPAFSSSWTHGQSQQRSGRREGAPCLRQTGGSVFCSLVGTCTEPLGPSLRRVGVRSPRRAEEASPVGSRAGGDRQPATVQAGPPRTSTGAGKPHALQPAGLGSKANDAAYLLGAAGPCQLLPHAPSRLKRENTNAKFTKCHEDEREKTAEARGYLVQSPNGWTAAAGSCTGPASRQPPAVPLLVVTVDAQAWTLGPPRGTCSRGKDEEWDTCRRLWPRLETRGHGDPQVKTRAP